MAKRFTDSEKWSKVWYRKLPARYKLLWNFILDNCDQAGVWEVDIETACYFIGEKIDAQAALKHFGERVRQLPNNKWWVVDFIPFQYGREIGGLDNGSPIHRKVAELAIKYRLSDFKEGIDRVSDDNGVGINTPQDKEEDKDKEKAVTEKKVFGEFGNVTLSDKEYGKLVAKLGEPRAKKAIEILSAAKHSKGYKYKSDYATFHTWVISELEKREVGKVTGKPKHYICEHCSGDHQSTFCPKLTFTGSSKVARDAIESAKKLWDKPAVENPFKCQKCSQIHSPNFVCG